MIEYLCANHPHLGWIPEDKWGAHVHTHPLHENGTRGPVYALNRKRIRRRWWFA